MDQIKEEFISIVSEILTEAGKTPAVVSWNKSTKKWIGKFKVDNENFRIEAEENTDICDSSSIWGFKFYRNESTAMFNDYKYPYTVVPTIKMAFEEVLNELKPDVIGFIANKEDKGRIKIYEKNAKMYSSKFHYHILLDQSSDFYAFVLYKDIKFRDCAKQLVDYK